VGQRRYGEVNKNYHFGTRFFVHHKTVSAVKGVEFVNDRMSYTVQRDRWCNIILFIYSLYSTNPSLCTDTLDVELVKIVDTI
jgi:hypothetical protein